MSTPSGKPFDPFDLSPYAPKRARERSALDRPSVESEGNGEDGSDNEAAVAMPYVARAAMRPEAAEERPADLHAAGSGAAGLGPVDLDANHSRSRPDPSVRPAAEELAADATPGDADLARLESSLQWLQREEAVSRLPRAVQLPPVTGIRPVSPEASRSRGEQFINGVRVPPSLAPERLRPPPPMRERRDNLKGPVRVLLASVIAAPIAYYFSVGNLTSTSEPARESGLASFAARLVSSVDVPLPKEKLRPGEAEEYINTVVSSRNKLVAARPTGSTPTTPVVEIPAVVPAPSPAAEQAAPPPAPVTKATRELDAESIKRLLQQGDQFVASGDLVAARLIYRRAAESGSAAAALALGATFDPVVLAKTGARGVGADVEKARMWYEKAREFGSPEAPRRIEMLANR